MDPQTLISLLESGWAGARVLVVGDLMLDKYAFGRVERISPEAPVPVVRAHRTSEQPGGAANVAMNIAGLGATALLAGFTGQDADGLQLESLLEAAGIQPLLVRVAETPTTSKLRILGGTQQIVRLDFEDTAPRPLAAYAQLLSQIEAALPSVSALVLSDYAKGVLTPELCERLIAQATERGIPVLVDPKSKDFSRYAGATTICPNLGELSLAIGESATDLERLLERAQALVREHRLQYLTVTMSEKGIAVLWPDAQHRAAAVARQVFDVSGAGDTVIAVLALCAAHGVDMQQATALANLAAGIVIAKLGTVPVTRDELLGAVRAAADPYQGKTLSLPQLIEKIRVWRAAGEHIVFTNGCFDLLHVGHVTLLEQCKRLGDRLIIGINSDASVSRLKGPTRPIIGQAERARLLSALAASDAVVIFDEATPIELIRAIRPDVLVKGGDYTEATVVGADEVSAWGGRVELVPLVAGFSTTEIVRRMAGGAEKSESERARQVSDGRLP